MSKKLTPARQKFVSLASKKFGEGEVISKEQIYEIVQENAMKVWETPEHKRKNVYKNLLKNDKNVIKYLNETEIDKLFNLDQHFVHVDHLFDRVFD